MPFNTAKSSADVLALLAMHLLPVCILLLLHNTTKQQLCAIYRRFDALLFAKISTLGGETTYRSRLRKKGIAGAIV